MIVLRFFRYRESNFLKLGWHDRLFTNFERVQTSLLEHFDNEFITEGNTIKKVYISNSNTRKISKGDILIFYRSIDMKALTGLGVVNNVHYNETNPNEIIKLYLKRSVYSEREITEILSNRASIVISFTFHFYFKKKIKLSSILNLGILKRAPQSITQVDQEKYEKIKEKSDLDEHYFIN